MRYYLIIYNLNVGQIKSVEQTQIAVKITIYTFNITKNLNMYLRKDSVVSDPNFIY